MFPTMPEGNRKNEESDPEMMARLLELELKQKRTEWRQSHTRLRSLRVLSFFFLFLVIAGSFFAFYLYFSPEQLEDLKSHRGNSAQESPSPTATPH